MPSLNPQKNCKYCCSEIIESSWRCSHCCRLQKSWWRLSGEWIYLIPLGMIALYMLNVLGNFEENFEEYTSKFTTSFVNDRTLTNNDYIVVFKVDNDTEYMWRDMSYQLIGMKDGKVSFVSSGEYYSWLVAANSTGYVTLRLKNKPQVTDWKLSIKNLTSKKR